ncbi:MAG: phytanoyl-CoA dioxygenase family protein [Nostoc sp.]|uniref:phytanoyl-CoA dioxygenase family protein n=1 Tax=Nostoc sp. TaxID=1180 RepID=UPI002FF4E9BD
MRRIYQELEENGYAVIDFLNETKVKSLLKFDAKYSFPKILLTSGMTFSINTSDLSYRKLLTQEVKSCFAPKLAILFPEYRIVLCNLVFKSPNVLFSEMPLHQDPSLVDEPSLRSFGVWCPLIDVDEQNGCLQIIKKSHFLNSKRRPFFVFDGFPYSQDILSILQQNYLSSIPMKAGQALVYDKRLFHGSPPNTTTLERVAAVCSLVPQNILTHFCYRETLTSDKLEVFEVEDEFYDRYIVGQRPEGVKRLGTFDYEVDPFMPEQLIEKLEKKKSKLDKAVYQKLDKEGYAVIDFLHENEIQNLLNLYQQLSHPKDLEEHILAAPTSSSDLSYRQLLIPKIKDIFSAKIAAFFPEYKIIYCSFLNRKPSLASGEISLHQDPSNVDEPSLKSFGIWCPLVDVDEQNGCLQVVPRSHLLNSKPRHFLAFDVFPYSQEILSLMQQHYLTSVTMKAGQALIYDKRLFHGSQPNLTAAERLVAICILAPKNSPTYFYYTESKDSEELEVFEINDTFYDSYVMCEKPKDVKSLGIFNYEVDTLTPELLVKKLGTKNYNLIIPSWANFEINFQPQFLEKLNPSLQKVAILVSNEFEGFSQNGGIGTYYTTLSQKLKSDGWYIILLLCQTEADFQGEASFPDVDCVFSTHEIKQVLNLQLIHDQILATTQQDAINNSFDYQSFCCLFFTQAVVSSLPDAVVYVEFPDIWGFGYRTIQAKKTGLLGDSCLTNVTAHGCFEWLREVNSQYTLEQPQWFWQAYHYEQFSYENADVAYFPSYFLKSKLESYGWKTSQSKHLPYFVPTIHQQCKSEGFANQNNLNVDKIPVVFFSRLEERKGLCTFVEAIKLLNTILVERIQIIFIGKIIPLQSSQLQHLDSQQYIEQQLDSQITYNLIPNLSSQDAMKFITELNHPIVCLTSIQENFPNTGLEMGQLPVSLVVSNTGGFQETLNLVERSDCVRWFNPGNSHSLTQTITQAINAYPEKPLIPQYEFLEQVNQRLLNQRLEYMSQAFINAAPKEPQTPKVTIAIVCWQTVNTILECLESLAAQTYKNFDVIIGYRESTDEYLQEIITQAQTKFPSYKYLNLDANWSLGESYNYLVELAAGEYVLQLAVEHIALPDMLEKLVMAAHLMQTW